MLAVEVDAGHPALGNVINYDFSGGELAPNSHATKTAGVICSTDPVYTGVAPGSEVYAGKVLS